MDYKEVLPEKFEKIQEGDIGIKTRTVIWYLAFSGFAINFILANSLPLAIVNMIDANYQSSIKNESEERVIIVSECIIETNFTNFSPKLSDEIKIAEHPKTTKHISPEGRLLNFLNVRKSYQSDSNIHQLINRLTTSGKALSGTSINKRRFLVHFTGSIGSLKYQAVS